MVNAQGEIWLLDAPGHKRRPVLVVTRNQAIHSLSRLVIAPLTSTVRWIPTCISVGPESGVNSECVANFDNLTAVDKSLLTYQIGMLGPSATYDICKALEALADC